MTKDNFVEALRRLHRKPFQPYTIELTSGGRIEVNHPEAVSVQGEIVVANSTTGVRSLFDYTSVSRLINATGG